MNRIPRNKITDIHEREQEQIRKQRAASRKIKQFLDTETERKVIRGKVVKSNINDNESAKMKTRHGVIQGYTGVALADSKHQVVVHAKAFGQGQEHGLIKPVVEGIKETVETGERGAGIWPYRRRHWDQAIQSQRQTKGRW